MKNALILVLALFSVAASAQRPFDPILETQITTTMNGVVIATAPDITVATLSGFLLSGDTLYNTATNTDAQTFSATGSTNPSLVVAGGTGGGGTVQLSGAGITSVSYAAGVVTITSTEADGSPTNEAQTLSAGGTTSPTISLNAISGTGGGTITFSAGAGITLNQSGGTITITNNGVSKWTDSGVFTYLTSTTDRVVVGASTEPNSTYQFQVSGAGFFSGGIRINGPINANGFNGTTAQYLRSGGSGAAPTWDTPGDITSATTGEIGVTNGTNAAFTTVDLRLAQQGATSGQVLKWNGIKWAPGTDNTGSGGLTAANNGLSVTGTTVQLGGSLIQATTVDQDGFQQTWKDGRNVFSRYNNTTGNVSAVMVVEGIGASPNTTGTAEDAALVVKGYNNGGGTAYANELAVGQYTTAATGNWIQVRDQTANGTEYPIHINPNGGKFIVGTNTVPGPFASVYASGLSTTGSDIASVAFHVATTGESSTFPKLSLGTNNTRQMQLYYNGTDVASRVNSLIAGSTIRFSVGVNENDDKVIIMSNGAGRLGAGFASTTGLHSTLQSSGSFAAGILLTAGAPTFDETKFAVGYTGASPVTWTLPTASTCTGRVYVLANKTSNTVTLSSSISSGQTTPWSTLAKGEWGIIFADSAGWQGFKVSSL